MSEHEAWINKMSLRGQIMHALGGKPVVRYGHFGGDGPRALLFSERKAAAEAIEGGFSERLAEAWDEGRRAQGEQERAWRLYESGDADEVPEAPINPYREPPQGASDPTPRPGVTNETEEE